ncbi:hypothetical protein M406DRAFT_343701 [Cryphonectria parasitica EP155]|uniref:Xaa-Pro dipeptidyl-peptidase C-terminal domain-containing protein n=1 Tax=Cryphonectria parasitica (strain ATCC 38755 / EP155) TaxID=660469 RepID=A0A9P4YAE7_CRYP1|nr:uncharacterized protein M406DRAFT_343701 [Cryphonectria parasitica EP155]KAF3769448.1 hypothetical protein M406DRAFT_343701 [Cryphonectria parasitica EP155]
MVHSPYGRRFPFSISLCRLWAARGYNVLIVSTRGTFGSTGLFIPAVHEVADSDRIVKWMRQQSWYTGTFGTFGISYLGYTQWALMDSDEPLEDYVAAVSIVGPHDFSDLLWGNGSLWLPSLDWAKNSTVIESTNTLKSFYNLVTADPNGDIAVKKTVPLEDGAKKAVGVDTHTYTWLHEWISGSYSKIKGEGATEFWKSMNHTRALEKTKVPILLIGGWQDIFTEAQTAQWRRLNERGCTVALTMGAWNHMQAGQDMKEIHAWFDKYLGKKTDGEIREAPAKINVTGTNEWKWYPSWPPATKPLELYLDLQGQLSKGIPDKTDEAQFTFDPHNPTPTFGGPLLFGGGYADDTALAERPDVLAFTTSPLTEDIEIHGKPHIEVSHSSDNPHVDLFVRLSEVNSHGKSRNICQAYRRLDPDRAPAGQKVKIELDLSDCAHHFKKGSAIRLLVAGGNFPHYAYNLGSGEGQATGTTLRPARHTVYTGGSEGSKFVLPALDT